MDRGCAALTGACETLASCCFVRKFRGGGQVQFFHVKRVSGTLLGSESLSIERGKQLLKIMFFRLNNRKLHNTAVLKQYLRGEIACVFHFKELTRGDEVILV